MSQGQGWEAVMGTGTGQQGEGQDSPGHSTLFMGQQQGATLEANKQHGQGYLPSWPVIKGLASWAHLTANPSH